MSADVHDDKRLVDLFKARCRWLRQACRQIFGVPDYDRYRRHLMAHHPQAPVLSKREFHTKAIEQRYGSGRSRCC